MQPLLQWKGNQYYTTCMCICSLGYPARNMHAPFYHLWKKREVFCKREHEFRICLLELLHWILPSVAHQFLYIYFKIRGFKYWPAVRLFCETFFVIFVFLSMQSPGHLTLSPDHSLSLSNIPIVHSYIKYATGTHLFLQKTYTYEHRHKSSLSIVFSYKFIRFPLTGLTSSERGNVAMKHHYSEFQHP